MKTKMLFTNQWAALAVASGLTAALTPLSTALSAPPTTIIASVSSTGEQGNGSSVGSAAGAISADGRFVAFASNASNLVSGDNNATTDIFVHDFKTRITQRASVDSAGQEGNGPSGPRFFLYTPIKSPFPLMVSWSRFPLTPPIWWRGITMASVTFSFTILKPG